MPIGCRRNLLRFALSAFVIAAGPIASQGIDVPESVPGCEVIGAPLSREELLKLVPGHIYYMLAPSGGDIVQSYSLLEDPSGDGLEIGYNPEFGEWSARYRISAEGICTDYSGARQWTCQQVAPCEAGAAEYVGWVGESGWSISRIEKDPKAKVEKLPVTVVENRLTYDDSLVAPAADWKVAEGDHFNGFPGLVGVYVAEGANATGPVITDYLTAHDFSTGQRLDDGRRLLRSMVRLHRPKQEPIQVYHLGGEGGTREAMLEFAGRPEDRLDLTSASAGVIDIVTDDTGEATADHWFGMNVHIFHTYAAWDPATHARPANTRIMSHNDRLGGRSVLICDGTEYGQGAPQVTLLGEQTCRRYDRAFEVTEFAGNRNALQIAAAFGSQEAPMVMQVEDISVSAEIITLRAASVPSFVLLNTGQFHGWGDWIDRTNGAPRSRPVICRFPIAAAEHLANLEVGDLLQFRADLSSASDASVELDCSLD